MVVKREDAEVFGQWMVYGSLPILFGKYHITLNFCTFVLSFQHGQCPRQCF